MKQSFQPFRLLLLALCLALGLVSTTPPVHEQQRSLTTDHTGVLQGMSSRLAQASSSHNWADFAAGSGSGNGFKGVEANWNAPCTTGSTDSHHSYASWVGLGGFYNGPEPLEQAGILLATDGTYRLFWEYISTSQPPAIDYNDVIHCGDPIYAWVHYGSSYCSNGGFYAHVQDNKTGAHWGSACTTESKYGIQSTEWIDERPFLLSCKEPVQLADFRYTQWSGVLGQANHQGANWVNPDNFGVNKITMHDDGTGLNLAYPDTNTVNSNNTFTGRWYAAGTYCDK